MRCVVTSERMRLACVRIVCTATSVTFVALSIPACLPPSFHCILFWQSHESSYIRGPNKDQSELRMLEIVLPESHHAACATKRKWGLVQWMSQGARAEATPRHSKSLLHVLNSAGSLFDIIQDECTEPFHCFLELGFGC
jgi:hypothetical protein